jgi:glycosyltransferase involved in cell wall biosynthesis
VRFCLLTTFYPPFNFGGDGVDVQRMARALSKRGHQVTVIHDVNSYEWLSGRHVPEQPSGQDGVEVIGLRSRLGVLSPLLTQQFGYPVVQARRLRALLAERKPDVIVFGNISLLGGPGLLKFGDALKLYVAHEHWLVCPTHVLWRFNREPCDARACTRCVLSYGRPPQLWRYTGAIDRQTRHVDLFLARSAFSRDKHREFGFNRPMDLLPVFPGSDSGEPGRPGGDRPQARPYFLTVGRLTRIKGLDAIIPAFRQYPQADWLVVGDGEEMAELQGLAADVPHVKFLGRLENADLRRYYEHAIAVIVPTMGFETFGVVLVEAFGYRTPVIARRTGPFPEIVDAANGGLLFSNTGELVDAMRRLHTDRTLRDGLGANAFAACRSFWSEEAVMNRLMALVSKADGNRSGGAHHIV